MLEGRGLGEDSAFEFSRMRVSMRHRSWQSLFLLRIFASTLRTHSLSRRSSPKILTASFLGVRFCVGLAAAAADAPLAAPLLPAASGFLKRASPFHPSDLRPEGTGSGVRSCSAMRCGCSLTGIPLV